MGANIVTSIVETLTSGIVGLGQGIAQGLGAMAKALFIEGAGTTESPYALSTFGTIIVIFAAVSLRCKFNNSCHKVDYELRCKKLIIIGSCFLLEPLILWGVIREDNKDYRPLLNEFDSHTLHQLKISLERI